MIRSEFVIIGGILVVLGLIISSIGYDKIQPTMLENVVTFTETVSGQNAPDELHPSKMSGYLLIALGGVSVVAGLGFIFRSRKK
jgi:hypothetical protein